MSELNQAVIDPAAKALMDVIKPAFDAELAKGFEAMKANMGIRKIHIVNPDGKINRIEGQVNKVFDMVVKLTHAGNNVMIVGPAGSGKTTLAAQVASALGLPYWSQSLSEGVTESSLFGKLLPIGEGGRFEYCASPYIKMYEEGGLFLLDEFDAANANVGVALNQSLAQSHFFSELRVQAGLNGFIKRHEKTRIMAACNTFGKGGSIIYSGRNQLDAATTDRFYMVYMDYDEALEKQIGSVEVVDWVHKLRRRVRELEIHEVVSTRMIIRMDAAINCGARTFREAKSDALLSWSIDHKIQVGEA